MSDIVFYHNSQDLTKTSVFTVDAPILTHNPTKFEVIRLGLCVGETLGLYNNRLTVFSWYSGGETLVKRFSTKQRLILLS